ncbi:MAG: MFS transporter [Chloroflexota bacterium]
MLSVLRRPNFALLWSAALISGVGNFVLLAALPYFVYATSRSVLASGVTFASEVAPMIIMPIIGGIFADRWRRKAVLIAGDWLRGLILLPLLAVHGNSTLWIVYVVAFLSSAVGNFVGPFNSAALPHVVEEQHLPAANVAFSLGTSAGILVGYPLGGLLLGHIGLAAVILVDAASFGLSGLLVMLIRVPLEGRMESIAADDAAAIRRAWREWLLGMDYVWSHRWVLIVFVVILIIFLGNGMLLTVLPAFVEGTLGGSAQFYSTVLAAQGAGGIAAALGVGFVMRRLSPGQLLGWGMWILGCLAIGVALLASQTGTLIGMFLAGPPSLFGVAALNTLLQSHIPDDYRGRVFGASLSINAFATLLGTLLSGLLADRVGSRVVFGLGGGVFLIAVGVALWFLLPALSEMNTQREEWALHQPV